MSLLEEIVRPGNTAMRELSVKCARLFADQDREELGCILHRMQKLLGMLYKTVVKFASMEFSDFDAIGHRQFRPIETICLVQSRVR